MYCFQPNLSISKKGGLPPRSRFVFISYESHQLHCRFRKYFDWYHFISPELSHPLSKFLLDCASVLLLPWPSLSPAGNVSQFTRKTMCGNWYMQLSIDLFSYKFRLHLKPFLWCLYFSLFFFSLKVRGSKAKRSNYTPPPQISENQCEPMPRHEQRQKWKMNLFHL